MKLKNKLLLYFCALFFVTINIYGIILMESNFNIILENTINNSLSEYSVIYANIKSNENAKNIFFEDKDILKIKSDFYFKNNSDSNVILEFRNLDKDLVYSTSDKYTNKIWNDDIYNINGTMTNYLVYKKGNDKVLLINNNIDVNNNTYYFTYINNLDNLYKDKLKEYSILIKLNIIGGIFLLVIIYFISDDITKPIYSLISSMNEVINGNYNKKLKYKSNIYEINEISNNFSLMNTEIQNKIQELQESNNEKQRFINNLTHEIRTPLTSIIGYSDLMLKKRVEDFKLIFRAFENINREGKRILSLASNLITLITLDEKSLNLSNFSALEMIEEVKSSMDMKIKDFDIHIIIEGKDFEIYSDRELVFILITNFVDNSIKAVMGSNVKEIKIILNSRQIIIKDTGIGISKDELTKIFEPFYMTNKSRNKSIDGFGLGLSICRQIVKLLNIKFNINSEVNIGTEIVLGFEEISHR
ncbi:HAMP domain-containing sensor histidine kinase [Clostridium sp. SM-530-WT-3G]|uniref:sensor histidine kinase n=1 Tax=Clostridium sp. SM-530-WT-3G TaxID=2725303 RepID=UPI00145E6022|nr:HAMP domain-containing sensor histidine kinase [Clostridium sp. SM-530-WT-3G]NME84356.1 HAMP domain-containing histidine kinase [Clostridium sp. SM-530-WT-3G]